MDFSSAFDFVNHEALIYKLQSVGVGGNVLSLINDFLSDRTQAVSIDGASSDSRSVSSGVPQGSVLGPLLFIIFTSDMWSSLENQVVAYADDTSVYKSIPCSQDRSLAAESLMRDLCRINDWCLKWGMKLNPTKSKDLIISRSQLTPLTPPLILVVVICRPLQH